LHLPPPLESGSNKDADAGNLKALLQIFLEAFATNSLIAGFSLARHLISGTLLNIFMSSNQFI